jgi:hypothetical protein
VKDPDLVYSLRRNDSSSVKAPCTQDLPGLPVMDSLVDGRGTSALAMNGTAAEQQRLKHAINNPHRFAFVPVTTYFLLSATPCVRNEWSAVFDRSTHQ